MNEEMNREQIARLFVTRIMQRAYYGVIGDKLAELEGGSLPGNLSRDLLDRRQWFQGLDDRSQTNVRQIIRASVASSVFGCLVVLDNVSGGYPLSGHVSEFALYLEVNDGTNAINTPQSKVKISPDIGDDLHDLFHAILREERE